MEFVLFTGLQGSGKSTFYGTHYAATHVLVSKDRFRNNRRPRRRQMQLVEEALKEGRPVVVDNTNPTVEDRKPIIALARSYGGRVVGLFFESLLRDCPELNARCAGRERVPDKALFITLRRLRKPTTRDSTGSTGSLWHRRGGSSLTTWKGEPRAARCPYPLVSHGVRGCCRAHRRIPPGILGAVSTTEEITTNLARGPSSTAVFLLENPSSSG
jgi:predicted kinase